MRRPLILLQASALGVLLVLGASPAGAQLGDASAAALAMGGGRTALARGFDAIAWNPAGLAMPGSGGFSFSVLPMTGSEGAGPVTMRDLQHFQGRLVDDATKHEWSQRVRLAGAERIDAAGDVTWLAMSAGRLGFQVTTRAQATGSLTADAVEVLLFGNAGFSGQPTRYPLAGSEVTGMVTNTVAVSYAHPLKFGADGSTRLGVGATVKYIRGLALAHAQETGGVLGSAPLELSVQLPIVSTTTNGPLDDNGHGLGVDLGVAWQSGRWKGGFAVQNAVSTFAWDVSKLTYRRGVARFSADTSSSDFDAHPIGQAPASLTQAVGRATFDPTFAAGLALQLRPNLIVSGDVRDRVGDAVAFTPAMQAGVGAEWRLLSWLPLRAGIAALTGGSLVGGGGGLRVGALHFDASVASRKVDGRAQTVYGALLTIGGQ